MLNSMKFEHDNLRKLSLIFLNIYFLSTVYERHIQLNFLSSVGIYAFLAVSMFYIINKRSVVGVSNAQFTTRFLIAIMVEVSLLWVNQEILGRASGFAHRFLTSVVIAFVIGNIVYTPKDLKMIMFGYCLAGAFLSINFYITYGDEIFTLAQKAQAVERMGEDYGNLNEVAQRCVFAFIISLYYGFLDKSTAKWRIPAILNSVLCFSVIMFTGSKKGLIVAVISVFIMFWYYSREKTLRTRILYILVGILIIALVILIISNIPVFANLKERFIILFETLTGNITEDSLSDLRRLNFIKRGWAYFTDNIFFGGGICYSANLFGTYAHNNYIEMLVNFGLIGFIIYYYGYVVILADLYRVRGKSNINSRILFIVLMCAIATADMGVVTYYDRYICIMLSTINAYFINGVSVIEEIDNTNTDVDLSEDFDRGDICE